MFTPQVIKDHLNIEVNRYCCNTDMFMDILIKANAECNRIEVVSADSEEIFDSNTI